MDDALRLVRQAAARAYLHQHSRLLSVSSDFRYRNDPATGRAMVWVRLGGEVKGYELSRAIPATAHRALALIANLRAKLDILISGGVTAEEAERNLANLIADRVEQEVGHLGMARMIVQFRRGGLDAVLDPEADALQTRQLGEAAGGRRSAGELAELSSVEGLIDQLEAILAGRVSWLREVYARILGGVPAEFTARLRAELEAAAPAWRELLEGEAPPDTGITALERHALQRRLQAVMRRIDECDPIGRVLDEALGRLIELHQAESDEPAGPKPA